MLTSTVYHLCTWLTFYAAYAFWNNGDILSLLEFVVLLITVLILTSCFNGK